MEFNPKLRQVRTYGRKQLINSCQKEFYSEQTVVRHNISGLDVCLRQRQCSFAVKVVADDGYNSTFQYLRLKVVNTLPYMYEFIQHINGSEANVEVHATTQ